jgi:hypothetical protein
MDPVQRYDPRMSSSHFVRSIAESRTPFVSAVSFIIMVDISIRGLLWQNAIQLQMCLSDEAIVECPGSMGQRAGIDILCARVACVIILMVDIRAQTHLKFSAARITEKMSCTGEPFVGVSEKTKGMVCRIVNCQCNSTICVD